MSLKIENSRRVAESRPVCLGLKIQSAIIRVRTYRRYANITAYHVSSWNSFYLRTYFFLVPHDLSKAKVFNTVI
jgi:hypothetical protein